MKKIDGKSRSVYGIVVFYLLSSFVFNSCSIDKRVYNNGYHIENIFSSNKDSYVKHEKRKNENTAIVSLNAKTFSKLELSENTISSFQENLYSGNTQLKPFIITHKVGERLQRFVNEDSCDVIIFKNGEQINAIVLEIGDKEVKFKECDKPNGPIFSKQKSSIVRINYPNGTSTVISSDRYVSMGKDNSNTESSPNDRSFVITILLWLFLGTLGLHRFYLGHIGIGILYLLTGGLCGFGWLIDGILLLTKQLKPKNGNYTDF